jgi:hypothetical protein
VKALGRTTFSALCQAAAPADCRAMLPLLADAFMATQRPREEVLGAVGGPTSDPQTSLRWALSIILTTELAFIASCT